MCVFFKRNKHFLLNHQIFTAEKIFDDAFTDHRIIRYGEEALSRGSTQRRAQAIYMVTAKKEAERADLRG